MHVRSARNRGNRFSDRPSILNDRLVLRQLAHRNLMSQRHIVQEPHLAGSFAFQRERANGRAFLQIGDRYADVELAHNAAARSILVRTGYGEGELQWHAAGWKLKPEFIATDLAQAVDWILEQCE